MKKKHLYLIITMLLASNGYFIYSSYTWQNEWFEQLTTTFDVETMFQENELCKVTYDGLLQSEHSQKYKKAQPHPEAIEASGFLSEVMKGVVPDDTEAPSLLIDEQALRRNETLFYFNNGAYLGSSKAKLVSSGPWLLGLFP